MSLIENLGGYDTAKKEVARLKEKDSSIATALISTIEHALLEYRRQHNIYEVGDKVVLKKDWNDSECVFTFVGIKPLHMTDGMEQIECDGKIYNSFRGAWVHATPQEIKAGRRL